MVIGGGGHVKGRCDGVAMLLMVLLWDGRRKKIIYSLGREIINLNSLKK